jgi:hypothetical protein
MNDVQGRGGSRRKKDGDVKANGGITSWTRQKDHWLIVFEAGSTTSIRTAWRSSGSIGSA